MNAEKLDEKLNVLESIVKELEKEDIPIEKALDLYAKGKVTVEECKNKIDMIEKEVLKINSDGEMSTFETEGADF